MSGVKIVFLDVDGTLTDAGLYYDSQGVCMKKFNTRDGLGINALIKEGIIVGAITGDSYSWVVHERLEVKLGLHFVEYDAQHKLSVANRICKNYGFSLRDAAFIGDDINDEELLVGVGLAACPSDAHKKVRSLNNILIMESEGGRGAVRDFCDLILSRNKQSSGKWDYTVAHK